MESGTHGPVTDFEIGVMRRQLKGGVSAYEEHDYLDQEARFNKTFSQKKGNRLSEMICWT